MVRPRLGARMKRASVVGFAAFIAILSICTSVLADQVVVRGPFGRPELVRDVGGQFRRPILVYSDNEIDAYIPDVTDPGWAHWFGQAFRQSGVYLTYLYTHVKKASWCLKQLRATQKNEHDRIEGCHNLRYVRRTIYVDTWKGTVRVGEILTMDSTGRGDPANIREINKTTSLSDNEVSRPFAQQIKRISSIIAQSVKENAGQPSAQDIARHNNEVVREMARKSYGPRLSVSPYESRPLGEVVREAEAGDESAREFLESQGIRLSPRQR